MTAHIASADDAAGPFPRLSTRLSRRATTHLIEGATAIAAGVLALAFPQVALLTLVALLAFWVAAEGVVAIAAGIDVARHEGRSWPFAIAGIGSLATAALMLAMPAPTLVGLAIIVGAWQLATGALQVADAWQHRGDEEQAALVALAGFARAGLGAIVIAIPAFGLQLAVAVFAIDAIVSGSISIATALGMRRTRRTVRRAFTEKPAGVVADA
jgi:uncharacterized membrane protein HdeD (DUF308 family)